jgi:hypothetical protein
MDEWEYGENLPGTSAGLQASPLEQIQRVHGAHGSGLGSAGYRSPFKLSDRFIPSRSAAARLDYSILDREMVTAEVSRNASEREVRSLGMSVHVEIPVLL